MNQAPVPARVAWTPVETATFVIAGMMCLAYAALLAYPWILTGRPWFLSPDGLPAVQDFLAYRVAGLLALEGRAEAAYEPAAFSQVLAVLTGDRPNHWLGWPYPPFYILLVTPLGLLPYDVAWIVWLTATAALLFAMVWTVPALRRHAVLIFAAPASLACIVKGQNGYLSAALMTGTLVLLDKRPRWAGVCLGLLAFKPHFGLVLPILLVATRRWTVFGAATLTVLVCIAASALVFGATIWPVFFHSATGATTEWMRAGSAVLAMQTVYAVAVVWSGPMAAAMLHGLVAAAVLAIVLRIWLVEVDLGAQATATIAATYLVTPYAHNHDAVMLGVAVVFLLGYPPALPWRWERPLAILALLLPGITLVTWSGPPSVVAAAILLLLALRRCRGLVVAGQKATVGGPDERGCGPTPAAARSPAPYNPPPGSPARN